MNREGHALNGSRTGAEEDVPRNAHPRVQCAQDTQSGTLSAPDGNGVRMRLRQKTPVFAAHTDVVLDVPSFFGHQT